IGICIVKQYTEIACPSCQRTLRVRTEYLGHRISCKSCNHLFRAEAPTEEKRGEGDAGEPSTILKSQIPNVKSEIPQPNVGSSNLGFGISDFRQGLTALEEHLQQLRNELAVRTKSHATAEQKLQEAHVDLVTHQEQARDLQARLVESTGQVVTLQHKLNEA